jgi:hypothetical protein
MHLPSVLENVSKSPGMYLRSVQYDTAVAFVQGFDAAQGGGLLLGFREWLVVKLGGGHNLSWPELVLRLEQIGERMSPKRAPAGDDGERWVSFLFAVLEAFLSERASGARAIFIRYDDWLRSQDWYGPSSPDWLPRKSP